jgi:hypothetical protein
MKTCDPDSCVVPLVLLTWSVVIVAHSRQSGSVLPLPWSPICMRVRWFLTRVGAMWDRVTISIEISAGTVMPWSLGWKIHYSFFLLQSIIIANSKLASTSNAGYLVPTLSNYLSCSFSSVHTQVASMWICFIEQGRCAVRGKRWILALRRASRRNRIDTYKLLVIPFAHHPPIITLLSREVTTSTHIGLLSSTT